MMALVHRVDRGDTATRLCIQRGIVVLTRARFRALPAARSPRAAARGRRAFGAHPDALSAALAIPRALGTGAGRRRPRVIPTGRGRARAR